MFWVHESLKLFAQITVFTESGAIAENGGECSWRVVARAAAAALTWCCAGEFKGMMRFDARVAIEVELKKKVRRAARNDD